MSHECDICQQTFPSFRGLKIHRAACIKKHPPNPGLQPPDPTLQAQVPHHAAATPTPDIPGYTPVNPLPSKPMNNTTGSKFAQQISIAYDTIIKWRPNMMKLPSGKAAKEYIRELTTWLEHFNNNTEFAPIALKVYHTLPSLMLQKPSRNSKSKEHLKKLEERLAMWKNGDIETLLKECTILQQSLTSGKKRSPEDSAKIFAKLMPREKSTQL